MTEAFKREMVINLKKGDIWGICCTDAAGMVHKHTYYFSSPCQLHIKGLDIRTLKLIIQYQLPWTLSSLAQ